LGLERENKRGKEGKEDGECEEKLREEENRDV